ncbi:MAG: selenocysteine-specific translation elongation factor [Acidobacteriota bacterium]
MTDHVVVGTAGHIDHGKSTLVRALTGIDPDRWEEEKRRGITIDIGFAHVEHEGVLLAFVDVPGHERFVHNMLAGASGIDLVMLVVAADESVMPQTREHLAICELLGVRAGVVALTRVDLADPEMLALVEEEIRETVAGTFLAAAPIVRVSGTRGDGLADLLQALVEAARSLEPVPDGPWPRLPIDRVFSARGFGTVVTGTLQGGPLSVGDEVVAVPGGPRGRIRGLQVHGRAVDRVESRHRVAVNLQGVSRERLERGHVLVPPGREVETRLFDALVTVAPDAPVGLTHRMRVRLHHGTAEVMARIRLAGPGRVSPGASAAARFRLEAPLAILPGDRFVVRRYSPVTTIGGGVVCELDPPRRRLPAERWEAWARELAAADAPRRLVLGVREAGAAGRALDETALRCGLDPGKARRLVRDGRLAVAGHTVRLFGASRLVSAEGLELLLERIARRLEAFHRSRPLDEGMPPDRLRAEIAPRWEPDAFRELLDEGAARGVLRVSPRAVSLANHAVALSPEDESLLRDIEALLDRADEPFLASEEIAGRLGRPGLPAALLDLACRRGRIVRIRDGVWAGAGRMRRIVERLEREAADGRTALDVGRFKELFGLSRKYAIPLLERLDDLGVTRRAGNARVIRRRDSPHADRPGGRA